MPDSIAENRNSDVSVALPLCPTGLVLRALHAEMGRGVASVPRLHREMSGKKTQEEDNGGAGTAAPVAAKGGTSYGEGAS